MSITNRTRKIVAAAALVAGVGAGLVGPTASADAARADDIWICEYTGGYVWDLGGGSMWCISNVNGNVVYWPIGN